MEMLHIILLKFLCVQTSLAWGDWYSPNASNRFAEAEKFRVSCEMNNILEFLMCAEDEVHVAEKGGRDFVMILGNSLSGKTTLTEYLNDVNLQSVLVTLETEEYMIFENYINFQRFYSLTVIPQQVFDKTTNTSFYDCPSFSSFQNFSSAVISTYLLKKVVDLADRIKIILTVSYSSVTSGESERDLLSLLTQTARFVDNITHFDRGIALMVTKVENRWLEGYKIVEDYTVREEIEEFLIDFKTHCILDQVDDYPFDNKHMCEKVLNLTDILLSIYSVDGNAPERNDSIDEDEINRIGLFRRPNIAAVSLSYVPILKNTKHRVLATIHQATEFTTVKKDNFKFPLGVDGIKLAYDLSESLNELLTDKTGLIADYFVKYFEDGGRPYHIYLTKAFFNSGYLILKEMYLKIYNLTDIKTLPEILSHTAKLLKVDIPSEHFVDLKINIDFILFLEQMAPDHLYVSVSEWIEPFWAIYERVRWSRIWYIFLNSLNKRLILPDIFQNKHKYDVEDVDDWGKGSKKEGRGIVINEYNYANFIKKLEQYHLDRWDDIAEYSPTEYHLEELNIILNMSFHGLHRVICDENTLAFHGRVVQTSMIKIDNCTPEVVKIVSSHTIEIDDDIELRNDKISLVLIAPTIVVLGDRRIDLSGKDGEKKYGPIIDLNFLGGNGSDGIAGSPGNASGHCVIICDVIMGEGKLEIIIQGGKGVDGQRGGRGGIGISRTCKYMQTRLISEDQMPDLREYDACTVISKGNSSASFKLMKCGTCGGSGGNGGKGGRAGPKGIVIYAALKNDILHVIRDNFRHGRDGAGGKRGGNGRTVEHTFTTNFTLTDDEICGKDLPESCPVCTATVDGRAGAATLEEPTHYDTAVPLPDADTILEHYVKEMGDNIRAEDIRKTFGLKGK